MGCQGETSQELHLEQIQCHSAQDQFCRCTLVCSSLSLIADVQELSLAVQPRTAAERTSQPLLVSSWVTSASRPAVSCPASSNTVVATLCQSSVSSAAGPLISLVAALIPADAQQAGQVCAAGPARSCLQALKGGLASA